MQCETPSHAEAMPTPSRTRAVDSLCFAINFLLALLFVSCCVISLGVGDNPFAFIGSVLFVLPVAAYATAEWVCWYRERRSLLRPLGKLNLLGAAFFAFGLVANLGEAFIGAQPVDPLLVVALICILGTLSGYLFWCGWRRLHAIPDVPNTCELG
jgi:hypothetical protein